MTGKERIELLQKKPSFQRSKVSYYYDLLEKTDGMKTYYTEYMTTAPVCCDEELKRLPTADYNLCCALLTMLLREDYFMQNGQFDERYEKGDVGRIIDRMIVVLKDEKLSGDTDEIKPGVTVIIKATNMKYYLLPNIAKRKNRWLFTVRFTENENCGFGLPPCGIKP